MAFAGVKDGEAGGAADVQEELDGGDYGAGRGDVVALVGEVASLFADLDGPCQASGGYRWRYARIGCEGVMMRWYLQSRCMSMITRAAFVAVRDPSCGQL